MNDLELAKIVKGYEKDALSYCGEGSKIQQNRSLFLDYYNQLPYGDEVDGQSKIVTAEVYETVEGMIPQLMRLLLQNRNIGKFTANSEQYDTEAEQKTAHTNYVFSRKHNATRIVSNMLKDGLLQYTGWVKVYQDQSKKPYSDEYSGLDEIELQAVQSGLKGSQKIRDLEQDENGLYSFRLESFESCNEQRVEVIPSDDCVVSRGSRDFEKPDFIGENTYKTMSELKMMGFDKKVLKTLETGEQRGNVVDSSRNHNMGNGSDDTRQTTLDDKSSKGYWLGEYYLKVDMDGDGIAEYWQVFIVGQTILSKKRVDDHPYCVFVPIPIPHRAFGTCPAEHVAPLQYWKSSLARQMNNNIYANNFNRSVVNENINLDDLLTIRHGGAVRSEGTMPVQNNIMPLPVVQQVPAVLEGINYVDSLTEKVSGVTAYNQGMDTESLNKTATGFQGIKDMSMMRIEVIARQAADTLSQVFKKIAALAMRYQNEEVQIRVHGEPLQYNPVQMWKDKDCHCDVDVGLGAGERQERISNLNFVLQLQQYYNENGIPLADYAKQYHTLDKIMQEIGVRDAENYFNDPQQEDQLLMHQVQVLTMQNQQMQAQMQNPLAEAEQAKGQMRLAEQQQKQAHEMNMKMGEYEREDAAQAKELQQQMQIHLDNMAAKLTDLELKYKKNVEGAKV